MPSYVALLRGVNLAAHNRVAMADLRRVLTDAGFSDVATHLQSGNAIFGARQRSSAAVEKAVEKVLSSELGLDIDVMVRTAAELAAVVEGTPYPAGKTLYVAFLKSEPQPEAVAALEPARFEPERFELRGRELYLHYPNGYGRTKMGGAYFERVLKVPATVRNWNVTSALAELAAR
ncbi:MAG TPA: DUF1697 domain-containing protein [Thermoleophilaceae bacterium]|nr:DUF1697 domain-containing protein [Thermoleophilaceae bacterium]